MTTASLFLWWIVHGADPGRHPVRRPGPLILATTALPP
jgi:hypothetical protein